MGSGGKSGSKETTRSCTRKTRAAEQNSQLRKLRPGYPHYQNSTQTRRQEKLGASQDKSKVSHCNDWCAKTGPAQLPLKKLIPLQSVITRPSWTKREILLRGVESTEKEHNYPEDPGHRAAVYDLLSPKLQRKSLPYTDRRAGKPGEGGGSTKTTYNKERGWPASKEGEDSHDEATLKGCNNTRHNGGLHSYLEVLLVTGKKEVWCRTQNNILAWSVPIVSTIYVSILACFLQLTLTDLLLCNTFLKRSISMLCLFVYTSIATCTDKETAGCLKSIRTRVPQKTPHHPTRSYMHHFQELYN